MALISCPECHAQISDKAPACPTCGVPITVAASSDAIHRRQADDDVMRMRNHGPTCICPNPNCGYSGPSKEVRRTSWILFAFLLVFFPIAILYALFTTGYTQYCPRCNLKVGRRI